MLAFEGPPRLEELVLEVRLAGHPGVIEIEVGKGQQAEDPYHRLYREFCSRVNALSAPAILEIGSRARSGNTQNGVFARHVKYVGMDIVAGENVNIVGDAHELSALVAPASFDAVFSISVFEHLAMPWKVALECNKVLRPGGLFFAATHQSWPLHDAPWDFWRFSSSAWPALFNAHTGFRVVEAVMGLPATIAPATFLGGATIGLETQPAYLGSAVIVEKVSETALAWPVPLTMVSSGLYPK
ncbi:MAG: hypothetical protein A2V77_06795 [Anaeromyxobacter sp. RBG_16_69_14]|nr:MAG: hypothetical protein A2V77_06795 [Anaeromyxobacter sp. RBG_16_69_14]